MKITAKKNNQNMLHICLDGELDQSVAEKIRIQIDSYLENNSYDGVVLDMSKLRFMDSTGIGLIMGRYKKLRAKNIPIYIGSPNPQIDKVLKVSGLYGIIPLLR